MSLVDKVKEWLKDEASSLKFTDFKVNTEVEGEMVETIFRVKEEVPAVGSIVEVVSEEGVTPVEVDGEYIFSDGLIMVIKDSVITEIKEAELPIEEQFSALTIEFSELTAVNVELTSSTEALTVEAEASKVATLALQAEVDAGVIVSKELEDLKLEFAEYKKGTDRKPTKVKDNKGAEFKTKGDKLAFFSK